MKNVFLIAVLSIQSKLIALYALNFDKMSVCQIVKYLACITLELKLKIKELQITAQRNVNKRKRSPH